MHLDAMAITCRSLNAELFAGRWPPVKLRWHEGPPGNLGLINGGLCWPSRGIISIHKSLEDELRRDIVVAVLAHELGHIWTRGAREDHGRAGAPHDVCPLRPRSAERRGI